ncbi:MAG: hypothetical protein JNK05_11715 [Myxococcales bacterium]|nr:hypothetical protein [Myxococcales bacterium]
MDEPLTKRDHAILRFVDSGELVAMRHLTACFFGQRKTARARVLSLSERGLLARYRASRASETLYTLGALGAALLGVQRRMRMPERKLETHLDALDICIAFARGSIEASLLGHAPRAPDIVATLDRYVLHVVLDPLDRPPDELARKLAMLARPSPSAPSLIVLASRRDARLLAVARGVPSGETPIACLRLPVRGSALGPCYARVDVLARVRSRQELRAAFSMRLVSETLAPLARTWNDESRVGAPRS